MTTPKKFPSRKYLQHETPSWVPSGSVFFITINTTPRGGNMLIHEGVWTLCKESIQYRVEARIWYVHLWLNMPDHFHALMSFGHGHSMKNVVKDWKRYIACHSRIQWQSNFFDHRIRDEKSYIEKYQYILNNPIRAGLIDDPNKWPYQLNRNDI